MQGPSAAATQPRHIGVTLISALVLIAAFGIVEWWSVHATIERQRGDVAVVDLAGQQRLRSQRIALEVESLSLARGDVEALRSEVLSLTDALRRSHSELLPAVGDATPDDPLSDVYHRPNGVDDQIVEYLSLIDQVIEGWEDGIATPGATESLLDRALDPSPDGLLAVLDEAVAAHGADAEQRVESTDALAGLLALAQLVVLCVVGLAVFRPLAARLRSALGELGAARDDLAAVLDNAAIGIITVDGSGRVESANAFARKLLCPDGGVLVGVELLSVAVDSSVELLGSAIADVGASGRTSVVNLDLRADDGRRFAAEVTVTGGGAHGALTILVGDISERLEMLRELERMANHDPLTGLPNRRSFRRSLVALVELRRPHRVQDGERRARARRR